MTTINSKAIVLIAVFLGILALLFVFGRFWPLLSGPSIKLSSPQYIYTTGGLVEIKGTVKRTSDLFIAGAAVPPDQNGNFVYRLFPQEGHTIIEVIATDRFGRSKKDEISVYKKENGNNEKENNQGDNSNQNQEGSEGREAEQGGNSSEGNPN